MTVLYVPYRGTSLIRNRTNCAVDRRERVNLCLSLYDLRNNYFILFDSITKVRN